MCLPSDIIGAYSHSSKTLFMNGKLDRLFWGPGWCSVCLAASAVISFGDSTHRSPVILRNGAGTNSSAYLLAWPTQPGARYQPQQSPDLLGWTTLGPPWVAIPRRR